METEHPYLMAKDKFVALNADAAPSSPDTQIKLWLALATDTLSNWDGRNQTFWVQLTPGQLAIVCTSKLYRNVKSNDLLSFIGYQIRIAARIAGALQTLGAAEHSDLWNKIAELFPKKRLPKDETELAGVMRMSSRTIASLEELGQKFLTGDGMQRPLAQYVYDYIQKHPHDFCQT